MISANTRKLIGHAKGVKQFSAERREAMPTLVAGYGRDSEPLALFAYMGDHPNGCDESLASAVWAMREGLDAATFGIVFDCDFERSDILDESRKVYDHGIIVLKVSRHFSQMLWLGYRYGAGHEVLWDEQPVVMTDDPESPGFPMKFRIQEMLAGPRHFASSAPTRGLIFTHLRGSSLTATAFDSIRSEGFELLGVEGFRFTDCVQAEREFASRN